MIFKYLMNLVLYVCVAMWVVGMYVKMEIMTCGSNNFYKNNKRAKYLHPDVLKVTR